MEIKFALNISDGIYKFNKVFDELEARLNGLIEGKKYGADLTTIYVGWICVTPEFESFFKSRKPKYYRSHNMSVNGRNYALSNALEFEIKLDYIMVNNLSTYQFKSLLKTELIVSLSSIIKKIQRIKDFDVDLFLGDLEAARQ